MRFDPFKISALAVCLATPAMARHAHASHSHVTRQQPTPCIPKAGGANTVDDVPAIESAMAACPSGTVLIPPQSTYHINSELQFTKCAGCTLQVEGTLLVSDDTKAWSGKEAVFNLEDVKGVSIVSTTGTGIIDGNGQAAWDLLDSEKDYSRVKCLIYLTGKTSDVKVAGITLKNPPNVFTSVKNRVTNVAYADLTLTAISNSKALPKNTDGFDLAGVGIQITNTTVVNGDDCIAVQNGAADVTVIGIQCTGSHGLSIGSIGKTAGEVDTVKNILFRDAKMTKCSKAAGIKIYSGGYGTADVSNVTWENVQVDESSYGFQLQSCYGSDDKECASKPSAAKLTDIVVKEDMNIKTPSGEAEYQCANTAEIGVECVPGASG